MNLTNAKPQTGNCIFAGEVLHPEQSRYFSTFITLFRNKSPWFMRHDRYRFFSMIFCSLMLSCTAAGQSWNFIKEKDGIKIYTRVETGRTLKSYKAFTDINAPEEKIFIVMEDINNTDWWDKNLIQIRVLLYEKNKRAQYYMVYDLPWPVTDRDLCVDVSITADTVTGGHIINAVSLNGVIPELSTMVRIKDYRQKWTIVPTGKETTHVELEGFVDPAGTIPDWISNMLIIESPLKAISGLKERMTKKQKK
jgi:hypothetical protein